LPVQEAVIATPSVSGKKGADDALVDITLFTSPTISLVHASELHFEQEYKDAHGIGQHHRYFYDRSPPQK
jgi:hypothetical protein